MFDWSFETSLGREIIYGASRCSSFWAMAAGRLETGKALAFQSIRDWSQEENKITIEIRERNPRRKGETTVGGPAPNQASQPRRFSRHGNSDGHGMHDLGRLDRAERAGLPWHSTRWWSIIALGEVGASGHEDGSARSPGIQVAARTHWAWEVGSFMRRHCSTGDGGPGMSS